MEMRKGQFMMITSILVGLILISTASVVSQVQSQEYTNRDIGYYIKMLDYEAEKIDMTDPRERQNFAELVDMVEKYRGTVEVWKRSGQTDCFNVTLYSPDVRATVSLPKDRC